MKQISLTIAICTRNRSKYLRDCLESIVNCTTDNQFSILIVDNNSTDDTERVVREFVSVYQSIQYHRESRVGLSMAKNTAMELANTDWIFFIDDDGKVASNFLNRLFWAISNYNFDCIGGTYVPYFESPPPKWLPQNFGYFNRPQQEFGELKKGFLPGGFMGFNLNRIKGKFCFERNLGMKGSKIGYGEEILFQLKLRNKGYKIFFDPEMIMEHLVPYRKLKKIWHLKSSFARGRDRWDLFSKSKPSLNDLLYLSKEFLVKRMFITKSFGELKELFFELGNIYGGFKKFFR